VHAEDLQWRPVAAPATPTPSWGVKLLAPQATPETSTIQPASLYQDDGTSPRVVRAQSFDPNYGAAPLPPVPPPPPPPPPPGAFANTSNDEKYNCAVRANCNGGGQGFMGQARDAVTGVPQAFGNLFQGDSGRNPFQSDHGFDWIASPVSNPFYFEDPRSLTEVRPILIYQHVPGSNTAFQGGSIWFYGLQARLAFTDVFSIVIPKLGFVTVDPHSDAHGLSNSTGFAELMLGPKFTFYRCESSKTVMAAGLNFDIPVGDSNAGQGTGNLSLIPYFSIAQGFWKSSWGSFNFMNTTGYSFGVDNRRPDFLFSSFHLDYDVMNLNKIFPLIELNWFHYTTDGNNVATSGFEGGDLATFGSEGIAGHDIVTLAVGARYKFCEWLQTGLVVEFPLTGRNHDVMAYRVGFDLIFRY
jgi:hypothetical protein